MGTKFFVQLDKGFDFLLRPFGVTMGFVIPGHLCKAFPVSDTWVPVTLMGAQRPWAGERDTALSGLDRRRGRPVGGNI
jgi:hypothetical protein